MAPSPTRSPRSWRTSTASTPPSTATAACAARSTRGCSATSSTRRSAKVKALFDPDDRFNPGVMVDAPPMTEQPARPGAAARAALQTPPAPSPARRHARRRRPLPAHRRLPQDRPGVMCPSYMATREEEHATRGRANALVKALSGHSTHAALGDDRLHEILDLCLECKACKSECPLSVDMATLKSEFLAHYQAEHGCRCARGCSARSAGSTGSAPPRRRSPTARSCLAPMRARRGIDAPAPVAPLRAADVRSGGTRSAPRRARLRGEVVFLADSFTTFTEPAIGRAAIELLEAAGWNVVPESAAAAAARASPRACSTRRRGWRGDKVASCVPRPSAASRSSAASPRAWSPCARSTRAARRRRADADGRPPRGCSRSCWSMRSTTARSELDPAAPVSNRPIVFHGHCHQKARPGTDRTVRMLSARREVRRSKRVLRDGRLLRLREGALRAIDADRRVRLFPALREAARTWSQRPGCRAASRSTTGWGNGPAIRWSW